MKNLAVYVVSGWDPRVTNDRVSKLLSLRCQFDKMTLVCPGKTSSDHENMVVNPLPNPIGLLRFLGLSNLAVRLNRYLFFPSTHVLFVMAVKRKLARAISDDLARGKQVCVVTTAPPHALCQLGLYIKKRFPSVRWIVDWQDLWSYDDNYYHRVPAIYRPRLKKVETAVLNAADVNVTTNAFAKGVLEQHYGVLPHRVRAIHHHFHRDDLAENDTIPRNEALVAANQTLRIGFLGTLFKPPRVPGEELLGAIADYRQSGLNVELHVHGLVPQEFRGREGQLRQQGLFMHGYRSHKESIKVLSQYDYLLLLLADLPNCRAVMSIKLPHYLMVERPILAIVPAPSAIANIVENTGSGYVLPVNSSWKTSLREILLTGEQGGHSPTRDEAAIEEFAWESVSSQWLSVLTGVPDEK